MTFDISCTGTRRSQYLLYLSGRYLLFPTIKTFTIHPPSCFFWWYTTEQPWIHHGTGAEPNISLAPQKTIIMVGWGPGWGQVAASYSCRRISLKDCTRNSNNPPSVWSTAAAGLWAEYVSTVGMSESHGPGDEKHKSKDGESQREPEWGRVRKSEAEWGRVRQSGGY